MIPAGRTLITQDDVAALHGMSLRTARRANPAPWDRPGHPAPVNPERGKTHRKLWDAEQAAAFARGEPVPELPALGDPHDLLDRPEAAQEAGMSTATWSRYESMERQKTRSDGERPLVPAADEEFGGVPFWYRATIETYRAGRADPDRKRGGGRPAGRTEQVPRAELAARVAELLNERDENGEPLSTPEIARRLGVNYRTALRHVTAARERTPVAPDQDRTLD
ncbi:hypothetical protein OG439_16540 [Amycolatopsis sp. NBC_01307]|uniref:hypothetical protein n=1 Tax=Amycolatopsis sp. NBC_01307 TaxID=2903561 RepID=UPI002E0D6EF6|nr:hypothetical protein OG439_16540 [Amycolatopsis sp. NBC_01307]